MVNQKFTVDLNKPLAFQVGHLGEAYQDWVHQPILSKEGPRFFANNFLELITRTEWWVVPVIWLPVACRCIASSIQRGVPLPQLAMIVVAGIFQWTFNEYIMHRYMFHMKTRSYWANTAHYLLHGFHHKHPMDRLRLVFPPAATAIFCIPFWYLIKLMATPSASPALFGGGMLGYVMYDCVHYYLHYGQPSKDLPKNMKRYHLKHHFRNPNKGYGITSSLWDMLFMTLPPTEVPEN